MVQIIIFDYKTGRNTVATATGHDTVEFPIEKNSQIQPNSEIMVHYGRLCITLFIWAIWVILVTIYLLVCADTDLQL